MTTPELAFAETLPVERVKSALAVTGYSWICDATSEQQFRDACEALGEIVYEADVRMGGARPRNYQLPAAISAVNPRYLKRLWIRRHDSRSDAR